MSKIIVIVGMHRSGTSLLASWLHANGLFLGDNLMSGKFDNIKGHFEDYEILKIHEKNLNRNNYITTGLQLKNPDNLKLDETAKNEVTQLIKTRESHEIWGWKEPRGTLFLDEWNKLNSDIFCIAIYRHYNDVSDSLQRRYKHKLFKTNQIKNPNRIIKKLLYPFLKKKQLNCHLSDWIIYSKKILDFCKKNPEKCVLISIENLYTKSSKILKIIEEKTNLKHKNIDIKTIFDPTLFNSTVKKINFDKKLKNSADQILGELEKFNDFKTHA